jgi:hypothetical protein
VELRDVFEFLSVTGADRYHTILMDVDNSPDPMVQQENARLYAQPGLRRIHAAQHPGGRVVFWSGYRDDAFARTLRGIFPKVECVPAKAYPKAKCCTHTLFLAQK